MAEPLPAIDVTDVPELRRLAEEVNRTGQARVLRRDGKDLAVVRLARSARKRRVRKTKEETDREAFLSSAGAWKGIVDVDQFLRDIEESRRIIRPPVELD